jgi:hypothetical protein
MNNCAFIYLKRFAGLALALLALASPAPGLNLDDPLILPPVGTTALRILAPDLLELTLISTKQPPPARVTQWNFVAGNLQYALPAPAKFSVSADHLPVLVQSVGFRRRPIYAAFRKRDLRIGNYLYLKLLAPIAEGQTVRVLNPDATLWNPEVQYIATATADRFSPAIHVNQQGYVPAFPKKAIVGYYLGTMGELAIPAGNRFKIARNDTGKVVFEGNLISREDTGFNFSPKPYRGVYEADFSSFTTPGEYRLLVPGLGSSWPFRIEEGAAAAFTRAYALGLYHQRCGAENKLPFTRHEHGACHAALAEVPTMTFAAVNKELADFSADYARNPRHTAPRLKNVDASLYPFVNTGKLDVSGGHHDAGDYSKYTINSAQLVHSLVFAVDNFPGVGALDNLGLPESGDNLSDLLQEAKWEADFLAKMQDADGGFYFLVYPRNRAYEDNVLPDRGDSQVVFPKNTAVTAAAVAALAQTASSPRFKQAWPEVAANYLAKARLGWEFLQTAFARHGRDGAYQKISHYGHEFLHDDEVAWAAAELFLATGDRSLESELISKFDPSSHATLGDGWVRLWEGYGCATRSYAYGVRSGRVAPGQLNAAFLAKCEAQLLLGAEDQVRFSRQTAYGTSFPDIHKNNRTAGWYFSINQTFDIAAAFPLAERADFLDAILRNMNYEGGCNPLNVAFVTGVGLKRQREMVHQYAINDRRVLPPSGLPLGSVQRGFQDLSLYPAELAGLTFPHDYAVTAPYSPLDIWADVYNLTTEFVNPQQGRGLASLASLMAMTAAKDQPWTSETAQIAFDRDSVEIGGRAKATLTAPGIDLSQAQIVWEGRNHEPTIGSEFTVTPEFIGRFWVEAEALLPDGRRLFAVNDLQSTASATRITALGHSRLRVSGSSGQTFRLEASGDLQNWIPLVTATLNGDAYDFHDTEGEGLSARFYRSVLLQ